MATDTLSTGRNPAGAPAGAAATAWPLTAAQRATLDAAARRIVPCAYSGTAVPMDLLARLADRIAAMPAPIRTDFLLAVAIMGHPVTALLTTGSPVPFARRDSAAQDAWLNRWIRSRLAPLRTIAQSIRRLTLFLYYSDPAVQQGIGYRGPLHDRLPQVPWEGALRGTSSDDDPVARVSDQRAARPSVPPRRAVVARPYLPKATDVLVVGSGAGGGVAAARLAEAGFEVTVLEAGPLVQGNEFAELEGAAQLLLYADQGLRASKDQGIALTQGGAVGGGTTVNWLIMLRTPDHVLQEWARRFGVTGMSPADMAPVFAQVEREVHARVVTDDAHSPNNRLIIDGARKLGWRAVSATINAKGCVRSGFCGMGCRYDAKQGALMVWLPRAIAAGATLVADARVETIELLRDGGPVPRKRVTVVRRDPVTGRQLSSETIDARLVVLGAGAIGTPLILQRSGMGGGGVGRWLRLHPTTAVTGIYGREMYGAAGLPLSAMCDEFLDMDGNGYGNWIECPPLHPALAAAAIGGFGAPHRTCMQQFPNIGSLISLTRDGADTDLSNGSVRPRADGGSQIVYRLGPTDTRHVAAGIEQAARLHLAMGAREVMTLHADPLVIRSEADLAAIRSSRMASNDIALFSAHVNGTCRMGTDAATSGATPDGERHGAPGIYIADGSLLPTALGVNPQETIMALATVVAGRIAARHRA